MDLKLLAYNSENKYFSTVSDIRYFGFVEESSNTAYPNGYFISANTYSGGTVNIIITVTSDHTLRNQVIGEIVKGMDEISDLATYVTQFEALTYVNFTFSYAEEPKETEKPQQTEVPKETEKPEITGTTNNEKTNSIIWKMKKKRIQQIYS